MRDPDPAASDANGPIAELIRESRTGRKIALARAISLVENQRPGFRQLLHSLHARVGRAHRIGITGPPGAGKSTLVSALVRHYRERGERIAVIAVDPTSPFTGGALLGDRIRMGEIALDPGVFIRSMATRGSLGGLALATEEVCDVVDAFGFDRILIETVGVGQTELDIASTADSTLVILVPESGDGIQAMKAGLMEVADLFVVNKSDRPGADRLVREISTALHLRAGRVMHNIPAHHGVALGRAAPAPTPSAPSPAPVPWETPVLQTVAETGRGIGELAASLEEHKAWLQGSGERSRRRRARLAERVRHEVDRAARHRIWADGRAQALLDRASDALERGETSPYELAGRIVEQSFAGPGPDRDPESGAGSGGRDEGGNDVAESADTSPGGR